MLIIITEIRFCCTLILQWIWVYLCCKNAKSLNKNIILIFNKYPDPHFFHVIIPVHFQIWCLRIRSEMYSLAQTRLKARFKFWVLPAEICNRGLAKTCRTATERRAVLNLTPRFGSDLARQFKPCVHYSRIRRLSSGCGPNTLAIWVVLPAGV